MCVKINVKNTFFLKLRRKLQLVTGNDRLAATHSTRQRKRNTQFSSFHINEAKRPRAILTFCYSTSTIKMLIAEAFVLLSSIVSRNCVEFGGEDHILCLCHTNDKKGEGKWKSNFFY